MSGKGPLEIVSRVAAGATGSAAWANSEKAVTTSMKLLTIFEKEAITELKKKM